MRRLQRGGTDDKGQAQDQAKYLFSGSSVIPEFLNGASKNALVTPTFGYTLIYRILPPFAAWLFMQISVQIAAYGGMYLLLERRGGLFYISYLSMILIYLLTNLELVLQFVGIGETYTSHRADMSLDVYGFWEYFREAFLYNDQHNTDFHRFFLPVILGAICISAVRSFRTKCRVSDGEKSQRHVLIYLAWRWRNTE